MWEIKISKIGTFLADWVRGNTYPDGRNMIEFGLGFRTYAFQCGFFNFEINYKEDK